MTSVAEPDASTAPHRAFLIAGSGGMLGTALRRVLAEKGERFVAPGEGEFDITNAEQVAEVIGDFSRGLDPHERGVLINAAAYTNVERAEDDAEKADLVNHLAAGTLAAAARDHGLAFVHVSTDFVFDGRKLGAYAESDEPNPLSVYGATKLAGERAVAVAAPGALIVRTAWVFGHSGVNFPTKIIDAARKPGASLKVVTDEVGSPTYTIDLARGILGLVEAEVSDLFHLAGSGSCSRFELACETLRLAGLGEVPIEPVSCGAFPTKVARPANSVLDCAKAASLGVRMPDWRDALVRFIGELPGGLG